VQEVRLGLNYQLGGNGSNPATGGLAPLEGDNWSIHGQTTYVSQYAPSFRAPYHGTNSLDRNAGRETWDATLYAGLKLWEGAEIWVMYGRRPRCKRNLTCQRSVRVRSCIRPLSAAAGPLALM
jgi:hypothetical protein